MIRFALVSLFAAGCAWAQAPIVCPASAAVRETASAQGFESNSATRTAPFERISIFDGPPAEMVDLAPTGERTAASRITQTWDLTGYTKSKVHLVCRYRGTEVTFTRILPSTTRACTFEFTLTAGRITGASTMNCR